MRLLRLLFLPTCIFLIHLTTTYACIFEELEKLSESDVLARKVRYLEVAGENMNPNMREMLWRNINNMAGPFNVSDAVIANNAIGNGSTPYWDHRGQANWGRSFPSCNGMFQSPINIDSEFAYSDSSPCFQWNNYNDLHPMMTIDNNGHTVEVLGPWGDGEPTSQPIMEGGPLTGSYQLASVHWHWGGRNPHYGAEHSIDSRKSPLEMHFVHFNTKFADARVALASGEPEAVAVVAMLFKPSRTRLPAAVSMLRTLNRAREGLLIYPAVFPLEIIENPSYYYTYVGSLTTPPCTEMIRWIVFESPLPITSTYIDIFKEFRVSGELQTDNFRRTQPLNGREITRHETC